MAYHGIKTVPWDIYWELMPILENRFYINTNFAIQRQIDTYRRVTLSPDLLYPIFDLFVFINE